MKTVVSRLYRLMILRENFPFVASYHPFVSLFFSYITSGIVLPCKIPELKAIDECALSALIKKQKEWKEISFPIQGQLQTYLLPLFEDLHSSPYET